MSYLSVIVTTYNRCDTLRVTLERLAAQTLPADRYEVLVVDDGSPDATAAMVADFRQRASYQLRYLVHKNRGPGYSQNRGIREAAGPWVLLLADDIHPQPGLLAAHYQTHQEHPEPHVAVAGKVVQSPELPRTVFLRHWNPFRYERFEQLEELSYLNFWACNVSFKKQFMLDYGMFRERRASAHEDPEVGWRLYKNGGLKLLYCKEALAYHYHVETIDAACKRAYERGFNFDLLTDNVQDEALYVRLDFVTLQTLPDFLRAYRGQLPGLAQPRGKTALSLIKALVRRLAFNGLTVPTFWLHLIRASERQRLLRPFVRRPILNGCCAHYFMRGLIDFRRQRSAPLRAAPVDGQEREGSLPRHDPLSSR